jgi:hypothetical protein
MQINLQLMKEVLKWLNKEKYSYVHFAIRRILLKTRKSVIIGAKTAKDHFLRIR